MIRELNAKAQELGEVKHYRTWLLFKDARERRHPFGFSKALGG